MSIRKKEDSKIFYSNVKLTASHADIGEAFISIHALKHCDKNRNLCY